MLVYDRVPTRAAHRPALLEDGVRTHIITAQPGGTAFLTKALLDRDLPNPPGVPSYVTLSSDPEHRLLAVDGDFWTIETQDKFMGVTYEMVQPAVVLIDLATGRVVRECCWSWKTMGLRGDQLNAYALIDGVKLVTYRPVIADLRAAIRERRPVAVGPAISMDDVAKAFRPADKTSA